MLVAFSHVCVGRFRIFLKCVESRAGCRVQYEVVLIFDTFTIDIFMRGLNENFS